MNNNMVPPPVLSVCIPTYNRPEEFKRMMLGLMPQITDEVEIVIRDDSSSSETAELFQGLVAGTTIRYQYFNGNKIGLDAANLFLLEKARGEFIWWFSDDDELLPGGITEVLDLIKSYPEINFIWANFDHGIPGRIAVDRPSGFFKDSSEPLMVLGTNIGLLSTYIVRREKGLSGIELARKHVVGFSFASTAVVLYVLSEPGRYYFMRGPYVLCHPTTPEEFKQLKTRNGRVENEAFDVYGVEFYLIVNEFKGKFTKSAIRNILSVNFSSLWRGMLVAWVGGWDTPREKLWKMFKLYWSFPEFWIALPIFLLPHRLNKFLYRIYKVFFSHRKFVFGRKPDL